MSSKKRKRNKRMIYRRRRIDVTKEPVKIYVSQFALVHRVSEDTIRRHPDDYPPVEKSGGRNMMKVIDIERWGGLLD